MLSGGNWGTVKETNDAVKVKVMLSGWDEGTLIWMLVLGCRRLGTF